MHRFLALLADAVLGQLASAGFVFHHGEGVAGRRNAVQAEDLDRGGRTSFGQLLVTLVEQGANPAELAAGHNDVAALQRAAIDQHGGDRAATLVELGLDHHAVGGAVGVGLQVEDLGLQQDALDQFVQALAGLGRDFDDLGFAAQAFDHDLVLQQLVDHAGRVRARLVHLVDGHDDRHVGGAGVFDRLDRLRHDAIVAGHHQDHQVGDVGAASPHLREGRVARGVEEGDLLAAFQANLVGADMLGDAAVLAAGHIGGAQGVQQAGLAVVDVTHDGDDRGPGLQVIVDVLGANEAFFDVGFRHAAHGVTKFGRDQLGGVVVDDVVDLQHHALTHQELDDLDTTHGHPVGQFLHGDDVRNDHFAADLDNFSGTAATLFLFTLARPANRGQRTHAVGGVSIAGHGLDRQAAFAAHRSALGARHGLAGGGGLAAIIVVLGPAADFATGTRGRAHGALDFRGRRSGGRNTRTRTALRTAGARTGAGGRARRQSRIADGLGRTVALGTVALRTITLRTVVAETAGAFRTRDHAARRRDAARVGQADLRGLARAHPGAQW